MMKMVKNIIFSSDKKRLTDRAFKQSMTISVVGIILCMIALCSATWAWYSENISSSSNAIYSANCDMSISVQMIDGENLSDVEKVDGKYQLDKDVSYKISFRAIGSAVSAYAIVNYGDIPYYTDQFEVFSDASVAEEFVFYVTFIENTSIEIYPCWGTSSRDYRAIYNGETYSNLVKATKQVTKAPATTQAPQTTAPQTTEALATTQAPQTTAPQTTEAPVTTQVPQTTAPQTTETPVTIQVPQTTAPQMTEAPVTTQAPQTTAPQTTEAPAITQMP